MATNKSNSSYVITIGKDARTDSDTQYVPEVAHRYKKGEYYPASEAASRARTGNTVVV